MLASTLLCVEAGALGWWMIRSNLCTCVLFEISSDTRSDPAVHLHNSLLLGIIYNASPDVHLPSSNKRGLGARGGLASTAPSSDSEDAAGPSAPRKRLRALIAGMPQKERARLKAAAKPPPRAAVMGALGWAGAGADMLEKKRKEEERRRAKEEKRRVREATTEIGGADWRAEAASAEMRLRDVREKLSVCEWAPCCHVQANVAVRRVC
jgi:transcriptional coactivator HFI1/ADA1